MPKTSRPIPGQTMERTNQVEFRAVDGQPNQIELSFSSEYVVERWFGSEVLSHDVGAVDLQRLMNVGTVLFNHGRDVKFGKMPVARIISARLDAEARKCRAVIEFDDDEDSQKVKTKVNSGSIKGVSFGYAVSSWEEVTAGKTSANGRFVGPASIAIKWEPYEISIEPTPADPSVGIGRSMEDNSIHRKNALFEAQLQINKNYL